MRPFRCIEERIWVTLILMFMPWQKRLSNEWKGNFQELLYKRLCYIILPIESNLTSSKTFSLDTRKTNQSLSLESQVQVKQSVPSTLCDILQRLEEQVMEPQTMERVAVKQTLSAAFWHHLQSWKQLEMQRQLEMITRLDLENI